jgi:hypothetical protein
MTTDSALYSAIDKTYNTRASVSALVRRPTENTGDPRSIARRAASAQLSTGASTSTSTPPASVGMVKANALDKAAP